MNNITSLTSFEDVCTLIGVTLTKGENFERVEEETSREVFCTPRSISGQEYWKAQQEGSRADIEILVQPTEYEGERYLEYKGKRYIIYRVYETADATELYCQERAGVEE